MTRCFILSSPKDYAVAQLCEAHMRSHGWQTHILIDPREWSVIPQSAVSEHYSTLSKGMYGNACAEAILDAMIQHSQPGERLVKTDCDVWLSESAAQWLITGNQARAFNIYTRRWQQWGGVWSAAREHVISARQRAAALPRCECAESYLNLRCLHECEPGCEAPAEAFIRQWQGGDKGSASTLPLSLARSRREAMAVQLFA